MDKLIRTCGRAGEMDANATISLSDGGKLDPATSIVHYADARAYENAVVKSVSPAAADILRAVWGVK